MTDQEYTQQITSVILEQLGGRVFIAMTGAKDFVYSGINENNPNIWLGMTIGSNVKQINRFRVSYKEGPDYYELYFCRQIMTKTGVKMTREKTIDGVYCDQLRDIFEEETGLYTSL